MDNYLYIPFVYNMGYMVNIIYHARVYPYVFRHSRLTELSKILPESMLCLFAGWVNGSKMIRVYVHNDISELEHLLALNLQHTQ